MEVWQESGSSYSLTICSALTLDSLSIPPGVWGGERKGRGGGEEGKGEGIRVGRGRGGEEERVWKREGRNYLTMGAYDKSVGFDE